MSSYSKYSVIIAGGGTGGHLFPALAIGDELEKEGISVTYIGSKYGIESKVLSEKQKRYHLLDIKGIKRTFSIFDIIDNIIFPYRFIKSLFKAQKIIKTENPDLVIGTGGYSSGLPMIASLKLNKKTLIHEQNSFPGITTRKLSSKVDCVCISYEKTKEYINSNPILTGNPLREDLKLYDKQIACSKLNIDPNKKTLLLIGGSQGSKPFNDYFIKYYKEYTSNDIQIIWQCGVKNYNEYRNIINDRNIIVKGFIKKIDLAYSAADLVVSRAGALSISELSMMRKAMILVPLPTSAGNHQYFNAKFLDDKEAAILVNQNELVNNKIKKSVFQVLFNDKIISKLSENAYSLLIKNSTEKIKIEVMNLLLSTRNKS